MKRAFGFLTASFLFVGIAAAAVSAQDFNRSILPVPEQPFHGKIGLRPADSVKDFPKEVSPPEGAPNILLILTDDVGFGASSTFGGPIPTPTFDTIAKKRPPLQPVPHDGPLLAHAGRTANRPQSPQRGDGLHHGGRYRLPGL